MEKINKTNEIYIGATIGRAYQYSVDKFRGCKFICQDDKMVKKYFPDKKELTQKDIEAVYTALFNGFVSATEELNSLAKRDCVHKSQIDKLLESVKNAHSEYDDFLITNFKIYYPRCKRCNEIILKQSETLKDTCVRCESEVYSFIIRKCGMLAVQDILNDVDIKIDLSITEIVEKVLKDKAVCHSLIERYNNLLKEGKI